MKKRYLTHSISQDLLINKDFLKSSNINNISTDFASKKLSEILNSKNNILNKNSNSKLSLKSINTMASSSLKNHSTYDLKLIPKRKFNFPKIINDNFKYQQNEKKINSTFLNFENEIDNNNENILLKNKFNINYTKEIEEFKLIQNFFYLLLNKEDKNYVYDYYNFYKKNINEYLSIIFEKCCDEKKLDFFNWKKLIKISFKNFKCLNGIIKIIFKELKNLNEEFNKINNKFKKQNDEINKNSFQIEILNKLIDENKNFIEKKNEIKNEFSNKIKEKNIINNNNIIQIFKLKNEINDLVKLLEKNKDIYFKYKSIEKENFIKNKNIEEFKSEIENLKNEKKSIIAISNFNIEQLKFKIDELENKNKELNDYINNFKKENIDDKTKVKRFLYLIQQFKENLFMKNEEILMLDFLLQKEKKSHLDTKNILKNLQN